MNQQTANNPGSFAAWHGSKHRFHQFSMDHVGSGEGAQAFGFGLYFSELREVAEYYREKLSRETYVNGTRTSQHHPSDSEWAMAIHSVAAQIANGVDPVVAIEQQAKSWRDAAQMYRALAIGESEEVVSLAEESARGFERVAEQIALVQTDAITKHQGAIYRVEVQGNGAFFEWDSSLDWQSAPMREVISRTLQRLKDAGYDMRLAKRDVDRALNPFTREEMIEGLTKRYQWQIRNGKLVTGSGAIIPEMAVQNQLAKRYAELNYPNFGAFYEDLVLITGSARTVSSLLFEEGACGIRYLDRESRVGRCGSYNYVVFDASLVQVVEVATATANAPTLEEGQSLEMA